MERIFVDLEGLEFSVYFEVGYLPSESLCSICKQKKMDVEITIDIKEIIDAQTQVTLNKDNPFWNDIAAQALKQYKHELKTAEAVEIIYEKYPDEQPSREEIIKIIQGLKFVCSDCQDAKDEKLAQAEELIKKQAELFYEPQHQL